MLFHNWLDRVSILSRHSNVHISRLLRHACCWSSYHLVTIRWRKRRWLQEVDILQENILGRQLFMQIIGHCFKIQQDILLKQWTTRSLILFKLGYQFHGFSTRFTALHRSTVQFVVDQLWIKCNLASAMSPSFKTAQIRLYILLSLIAFEWYDFRKHFSIQSQLAMIRTLTGPTDSQRLLT